LKKTVNFFEGDKRIKFKKYATIMEKLFERYRTFEEYQKSILKRSEPFSFLKGKEAMQKTT
jgi:hypothetical protein